MTDKDYGPLPKFGSWDVNNPGAAGQQYSMIFDKARNEKRAGQGRPDKTPSLSSSKDVRLPLSKPSSGKRWLCCTSASYADS